MKDISIALASLADQHVVTVRHAATMHSELKALHISPASLTEGVIRHAEQLVAEASQELEQRVRRLNSRLVADVGESAVAQEVSKPQRKRGNVCRVKIFGKYPVTAVLRWMGSNGWNFEDAGVALAGCGAARVSDTTIKLQLQDGRKGTGHYGTIPELSKYEIRKLKQLTK